MAKKEFIVEKDGFAVITLARPEKVNGETVDALSMREPTVGDMKVVQTFKGSDAEREIFGIGNLTGLTPKEVEALSMRNFGRLQEAFKLFTS